MSEIVLLISDVHLLTSRVDHIVSRESFDKILVLGDIFHTWHDTPEMNKKAAEWLKPKLYDDKWIFVAGNHDTVHFYNNKLTKCSGWNEEKHEIINSVLTEQDWDRFKWFYWLNDKILVSHAGLTLKAAQAQIKKDINPTSVRKMLEKEALKATNCIKSNYPHWFFQAGRSRGGMAMYSGIVWADWRREFTSIPGLIQYLGHTECHEPETNENGDWCLDSRMNHYSLWRDGKLTIKSYNDL